MSALLIQAPDSKRWHIGLMMRGEFAPACGLDFPRGCWCTDAEARSAGFRTPHGVCSNCAREVESAVRLIAVEESRNG